jgi:NAD-dependent dihydropyrimidine dehydrogenase PreA subunit
MVYVIDREKCLGCGACVPYCAVNAIKESGNKYAISVDVCTGCGACVSVCPTGAISRKAG